MIRVTINNTGYEPQVVVVNSDQFLPSRQLIRQQLDTGKLGEVGLVRVHRWEPSEGDVFHLPGLRRTWKTSFTTAATCRQRYYEISTWCSGWLARCLMRFTPLSNPIPAVRLAGSFKFISDSLAVRWP